jgi:hypothetical protein
MYLEFTQDTNLGTVQGSVVSPLFYNIYFNEFNNYINIEFRKLVNEINSKENRVPRPINKLYNSISKKKSKLGLSKELEKVKEYVKNSNYNKDILKDMQNNIKELKKKYKELDKEQKKVPTFSLSRQEIRFFYQRYADDWVFFTNASKERTLEWKGLFTKWIKDNLELELSPEKTKVADLREGDLVKFLGFQLMREKRRKNLI